MHIFYATDIISKKYTLSENESRHCLRVLRLKIGDEINLIDGKGNFYHAKIIFTNKKRCTVALISKISNYKKRDFKLHIAIAPPKSINRFEFFLEKTTEIGIEEITPLLCRYSERKIIKPERLNKILLSAVKQSDKAYLPKLNVLTDIKKILNINFPGKKIIAHCYNTPKKKIKDIYNKGENVLILIGPEGDFSEKEVMIAERNGFISVNLSNSRLRTETAAITATVIIDFLNQ